MYLDMQTAQALFDGASIQSILEDIPELQHPPLPASELEKRSVSDLLVDTNWLYYAVPLISCRAGELRDAIGKLVTISRVLRHRRAMEGDYSNQPPLNFVIAMVFYPETIDSKRLCYSF